MADGPSAIDERTPRPDPRLDVVGVLGAAAAAAVAYVGALSADVLPSNGFSVVLFAAAPLLALVALVVVAHRARAEQDPALGWFASGLAVSVLAMLLQLISFPAIAEGGGLLGTSGDGSSGLYLLFHLALALGALLGGLSVSPRWRVPFAVAGALLALGFAGDLIPLPQLLTPEGRFTTTLTQLQSALAVVMSGAALAWLARSGRSARSLHTWIGLALSLSVCDVVLNALSARRFDAVWWSSLSMRVATFAVLALGATVTVLRLLARWERYTEDELTRREAQLQASLATTQQLLQVTTETAETLQKALRPQAVVAPPDVEVAARSQPAAANGTGIGRSWYDTVLLPSGGAALVVGQVDGRDLGAAPVMGLVRGAVRSYALEGHPPSVVLERVNGFLLSAAVGRQVTVVYVELYPQDRMVTVALAGHRAPLVVQPGPEPPQPLPCRPGPPLGASDRGRWEEQTLLLPADSTLLLCTPGVAAGEAGGTTVALLADALLASADGSDDEVVLVARPGSAHRRSALRTLPVHRMSAGVARSWVSDLFGLWARNGDLPDGAFVDDVAGVAQLLVTELVTNAVRHSDLTVVLEAELAERVLRVEVSDTSHRMPVLRQAGGGDTSGRGLFLVETMARAWGVRLTDTGKTVWFELDVVEQDDAMSELDEDALLAAFADPGDL